MKRTGVLKCDASFAMPFRLRFIGDSYVITNDQAEYHILEPDELQAFMEGTLKLESETYQQLAAKGFIRSELDQERAVEKYREKNQFLFNGPSLHIVIVTLKCNQSCSYCHASRVGLNDNSTDMTPETAEKFVEFIFNSTSPTITIEFQGGEPLANFDVVKQIVSSANERNSIFGKKLTFSMVSNLSLMDDEKLRYLIENRIQVCTSLDGPEELHNSNRILRGGNAFAESIKWMKKINEAYKDLEFDSQLYSVEALHTTTRDALGQWKEIIDTYVENGCSAIFLRPINPFGFAIAARDKIAYEPEEFLDFYRKSFDYILELNRQGTQLLERTAAIFLTKILTPGDPNFLDIRSPCGAGIGQIAYNYNGKIFTCDEGRMVATMGDNAFCLGEIDSTSYNETVTHETVRALLIASCLDGQPDCDCCAYKPYCGVCPVYNYTEQGDIFGRMVTNARCKIMMGIQDHLFNTLNSASEQDLEILKRWTLYRERNEFYQPIL